MGKPIRWTKRLWKLARGQNAMQNFYSRRETPLLLAYWQTMAQQDMRNSYCGDLSTFGSGAHQHYRNSAVNNAWIAWKARASLQPPGFTAADMATVSAQGFRDGVASVSAGWISVDERLPEPGNPVLLDIGKKYPIRALWAAKNTVRVGTDVDDWGEYDEETDEYYCPEGWYEWNEHEEVHWAVSETPRAWRELPTTPRRPRPC